LFIKTRSILKEYVESIDNCDSKESLIIELNKVRLIIKNNRSFAFFLTKNKIVYSKILDLLKYKNTIGETVYRYMNNINFDIKCKCGNLVRYVNNSVGYRENCGLQNCEFVNKKRNISIKKSFDIKYGCHPMKLEKTKIKLKESVKQIYGVENVFQSIDIKEKIKLINLEKYGVDNPSKCEEIKNKVKKSNMIKYGGHPMQIESTYINNLISRVKFKDYILPSGNLIRVQGYEIFGIEYLLSIYNEEDIICDVKSINKLLGIIKYKDKNQERRYYPDFYIKSIGKIYEVKSIWTYKANINKNNLKKLRCLEMGIDFEFLIFDYKGNQIVVEN